MTWQPLSYSLLLFIVAVLGIFLARSAWRRRPVPGAAAFTWLMLAAGEWALTYALELSSADLWAKVFWAKTQYLGIVLVPVAWLAFALQYTGRGEWLTQRKRHAVLLMLVPLVTLALVWTNEAHHLVWADVSLTFTPFTTAIFTGGFWYPVNVAYAYLLVLGGTLLLLQELLRLPRLYHQQVIALVLTALLPWLANALYMLELPLFSHLDLTPFAFVLAGLVISLGFFRFQLLDFGPVARDIVIENMRDGVFILDVQGRIIDLNPAACQIIGRPAKAMIGQLVGQALPDWPDLQACQRGPMEVQVEFALPRTAPPGVSEGDLPAPAQQCYYDLRISPLYNWFNRLTGHLILLSNITERVLAEKVQREAHYELERRVAERTDQLEQSNATLQVEIAERKKAEEQAKHQSENLLAVNKLAIELAAASPDTDIFALIAETLKAITGAFAATISLYDPDTKELVLKHVAVKSSALTRANKLLGWNFLNLRTPVSPALYQRMLNEGVTVTTDLTELTAGVISPAAAALIKKVLNIESFTALALHYAGELLGSSVMVTPKGRPALNLDLMQIFAYVVATALRRKQAEEALRQSEEEYRLLFENAYDVIYSLDLEFKVRSVSPSVERALGYKPEELIGKSILELNLLPPDQMEVAVADVRRILAGERISSAEYQFLARDGARKFGEVSGTPLIRDGQVQAIISVARDITERKQAQEARLQASRLEATATLAGGMAHDVNNLMVGVLGYAELLKTELARQSQTVPSSHVNEMLDNIMESAQHTGELAHQLLAFARRGQYQLMVINLNDTVQGVVQVQKPDLSAEIRVELNLAPDLWPIKADPTQMSQVVFSLVTNAAEAITGSGHITITTRNLAADEPSCQILAELGLGPYVYLSVQDTGDGIPADHLPKLFEPFFTTKFQGRGLGLAAAYGIVENHGGRIAVRSQVGYGTTFEVYLPALKDSASPISVVKEKRVAATDGKETVLIVEDNEAVLVVTQAMIEELGYRVLVVRSGLEALQLLQTHDSVIHLALLDMVMPGLSGIEVFALLKQTRPQLKVIIYSGYPLDASAQALLDAGASAFIQKPFQLSLLEAEIRKALDS